MTKNPQALLLAELKNGPSYGLELVERTGLGVGTVYVNLRNLWREKQIEVYDNPHPTYKDPAHPGRPRTYYRLVKP